jgi:hypothetical protein
MVYDHRSFEERDGTTTATAITRPTAKTTSRMLRRVRRCSRTTSTAHVAPDASTQITESATRREANTTAKDVAVAAARSAERTHN